MKKENKKERKRKKEGKQENMETEWVKTICKANLILVLSHSEIYCLLFLNSGFAVAINSQFSTTYFANQTRQKLKINIIFIFLLWLIYFL